MQINASSFIQNRKRVISITSDRINNIIWYIAECYNLLITANSSPIYNKDYVATSTTLTFEDYLKIQLVENYLIKNKQLLANRISNLEEITFNYETVKTYIDLKDGKEKSDKIDVYVNKLGLKDEWTVADEHLYLAIECKRISKLSECQSYIEDIQKFCDREHKQLRIPFEGQIAFLENSKLNHANVSVEVNNRLKTSTTITTKKFLEVLSIHDSFDGLYSSVHKKNYKKKDPFTIFHLLLDYSQLVN